jgi:hypothetical protein
MVSLSVRHFTGRAASFEVDTEAMEVSMLKNLIAASSLSKVAKVTGILTLSWKGHTLSDERYLSYYGIGKDAIIQIRM